MYVVIHQVPDVEAHASPESPHDAPSREAPGLLDIAGRPLILRQIDWLRATGAKRILVELDDSAGSKQVARLLDRSYGVGGDLVIVPSSKRIGPREIARQVGIDDTTPIVALPADLLGDGDLRLVLRASNAFGAIALFDPPRPLRKLHRGTVRIVRAPAGVSEAWRESFLPSRATAPAMVRGPGWAVRMQSPRDALAVTLAVISEALPPVGGTHVFPIEPAPKTRSGVYTKVTEEDDRRSSGSGSSGG